MISVCGWHLVLNLELGSETEAITAREMSHWSTSHWTRLHVTLLWRLIIRSVAVCLLTSSTRHSISQYIAIYAISKGHRTPCTAIQKEQRHHLNSAFKGKDAIILPDGDRDVISFWIYFYLPSLDRFFFPFWKSGKSERSYFLALFNSEIGAVSTKSEHLARIQCTTAWIQRHFIHSKLSTLIGLELPQTH